MKIPTRPSIPVWCAEFGHQQAVLEIEFRCTGGMNEACDKAQVILQTLVVNTDVWSLNGIRRID